MNRFDVNLAFISESRLFDVLWPAEQESVPFANGYYVAAIRGEGPGGAFEVVGHQILADGTILPVRVLAPMEYGLWDFDLHPAGERLLVVMKRDGIGPVMGTFIDADGGSIGPQPLATQADVRFGDAITESVRLKDGTLALVMLANGVATVTPLSDEPALPRRRAARH